jgi:hypothetical protein
VEIRETKSPVGTTETYPEAIPGTSNQKYSAMRISDPLPESRKISQQSFQSSLRDFSFAPPNPGLRPGLSSAVPTGLDFVMVVLTLTLKPKTIVGLTARLKSCPDTNPNPEWRSGCYSPKLIRRPKRATRGEASVSAGVLPASIVRSNKLSPAAKAVRWCPKSWEA